MTMFRASYSDTADGQRWTLCGRLTGPWVEELRRCWRQAPERAPGRAVVDMKEVTFIDEAGKKLLGEMLRAGAEFIVKGVENKHLLESLENRGERAPRRGVAE
jgi:hypothetical protein